MQPFALSAPRIFDGTHWHEGAALLVAGGQCEAIVPAHDIPHGYARRNADGAMLVPGFVDLQVNGGGGVLFNETPTPAGIERICKAHARFGTTALLPTLITDTPDVTARAIAAGIAASAGRIAGFLGLHLEGPHLSLQRKGAHRPDLIRPMQADDLARLVEAAPALPVLLTTLAPENATRDQVGTLRGAGIHVSLGHSDCTFTTALDYAASGATLVTHLYNAMSPLTHRAPGLVGAAIDCGTLHAGLIGDGIHVDEAAIRIALRAKSGPGNIFLVSDAMPTIGTAMQSFTLNGRTIRRHDGRLTLEDGTLAGADIDMAASVRFMHGAVGIALDEALRMASLYPAHAVGMANRKGSLAKGCDADFAELDADLHVVGTWIGGTRTWTDKQAG